MQTSLLGTIEGPKTGRSLDRTGEEYDEKKSSVADQDAQDPMEAHPGLGFREVSDTCWILPPHTLTVGYYS